MTRHRTADLEPTSFGGRYTLVRRLAVGGMAEIYLARQGSAGARHNEAVAEFEKEVVIKRLRAELADDPRIVEMFLDEARIGALLNHPNVVHVYDVDEHDGIPYIAMEYIVGEELNELCRRGIGHGKFLPLEHAVELMRQAAAGLGYFHSKRGAVGTTLADQPLDIVHLDISPSNLLVTQDGFLKVIDFGISRARGRTHHDSVIPGKLSYMSPEQAGRIAVDHRSDIFSLGIVLYEITVGKRLFRGQASEVVERLTRGKVEPPTFVRRNFPVALEAIVMRALERHPEDRYQSAYDLADDLETFLRDERLHSGPVRIARYLDMLAIASGDPHRPELQSEARDHGARTGDDLDFDRQAFDGYVPAEGAPGPEQAPEWEDAEQSEADVALALGMELAELRALRTPVPTRPSGVQVTRRPKTVPPNPPPKPGAKTRPSTNDDDFGGATRIDPEAARAAAVADAAAVAAAASVAAGEEKTAVVGALVDVELDTNPTAKQELATDELGARDSVPLRTVTPPEGVDVQLDSGPAEQPAVAGADAAALAAAVAAAVAPDPSRPVSPAAATRQPKAVAAPVIGASMLRASAPTRLPWLLAALLGLAVVALVAYIALR
jgi:serine/threonine protein kinase